MNIEIKGAADIKSVEFKKHFLKRNKSTPREVCGLTMIIDIDVHVMIGGVKLETTRVRYSNILSAVEFKNIKQDAALCKEAGITEEASKDVIR